MTAFLGQTHLFTSCGYDLDINEKVQLFKTAQYKLINRGDKVYKRGDEGRTMYFIIKGEIAVTFPTAVGNKTDQPTIIDVVTTATNLKREISIVGGSNRGNQLSRRNSIRSNTMSRRGSIRSMTSKRVREDESPTKGSLLALRKGTFLV